MGSRETIKKGPSGIGWRQTREKQMPSTAWDSCTSKAGACRWMNKKRFGGTGLPRTMGMPRPKPYWDAGMRKDKGWPRMIKKRFGGFGRPRSKDMQRPRVYWEACITKAVGGAPQDYVLARVWLTLTAEQGSEKAADLRDFLEEEMTLDQLAEAQRRAREWKGKGE